MKQVLFHAPTELIENFDKQAIRLQLSRSALLRLLMAQVVNDTELRFSVTSSPELEPLEMAELEY